MCGRFFTNPTSKRLFSSKVSNHHLNANKSSLMQSRSTQDDARSQASRLNQEYTSMTDNQNYACYEQGRSRLDGTGAIPGVVTSVIANASSIPEWAATISNMHNICPSGRNHLSPFPNFPHLQRHFNEVIHPLIIPNFSHANFRHETHHFFPYMRIIPTSNFPLSSAELIRLQRPSLSQPLDGIRQLHMQQMSQMLEGLTSTAASFATSARTSSNESKKDVVINKDEGVCLDEPSIVPPQDVSMNAGWTHTTVASSATQQNKCGRSHKSKKRVDPDRRHIRKSGSALKIGKHSDDLVDKKDEGTYHSGLSAIMQPQRVEKMKETPSGQTIAVNCVDAGTSATQNMVSRSDMANKYSGPDSRRNRPSSVFTLQSSLSQSFESFRQPPIARRNHTEKEFTNFRLVDNGRKVVEYDDVLVDQEDRDTNNSDLSIIPPHQEKVLEMAQVPAEQTVSVAYTAADTSANQNIGGRSRKAKKSLDPDVRRASMSLPDGVRQTPTTQNNQTKKAVISPASLLPNIRQSGSVCMIGEQSDNLVVDNKKEAAYHSRSSIIIPPQQAEKMEAPSGQTVAAVTNTAAGAYAAHNKRGRSPMSKKSIGPKQRLVGRSLPLCHLQPLLSQSFDGSHQPPTAQRNHTNEEGTSPVSLLPNIRQPGSAYGMIGEHSDGLVDKKNEKICHSTRSSIMPPQQPEKVKAPSGQTVAVVTNAVADNSASQNKRCRSRKAKKTVDPDRPKRPLSAYNIFFQDERANMLRVKDSKIPPHDPNSNARKRRKSSTVSIGFAEMARTISQRWKVVDSETVAFYEQKAVKDKERYQNEMKQYHRKQQVVLEKNREDLLATVDEETKRRYFNRES